VKEITTACHPLGWVFAMLSAACGTELQPPVGGPDFDASVFWEGGLCNPFPPAVSEFGCTPEAQTACQQWAEGAAIGAYGISLCTPLGGDEVGYFCGNDQGWSCGGGPECDEGYVCASDTPSGTYHCIPACNWLTTNPAPGTNLDASVPDGYAYDFCPGGLHWGDLQCSPERAQICEQLATAQTINHYGHSTCQNGACTLGDFCPPNEPCRCSPTLICADGTCYSDTPDGDTHCADFPCSL
jgi:hypothetical protein